MNDTAEQTTAPEENISREEWLEEGRRLGERTERDRWALGDWANYGDRKHGDLADAAVEIGLNRRSLYHLSRVAKRIQSVRRRTLLSWDHHAAVAGLPADTGDLLLDRAEAEGWSRQTLREEAVEASEVGRLRKELEAVKRQLGTQDAARDWAREVVRRAKAASRRAVEDLRDLALIVQESAEAPELDKLHGHAKAGLKRDLEKLIRETRSKIDSALHLDIPR